MRKLKPGRPKPVLTLSRDALKHERLVYVLIANKKLKYRNGRSAVAYIGTTKRGVARVASSAAQRARSIFDHYGVRSVEARVIACPPRKRVKAWLQLEKALIYTFFNTYHEVPRCNTQGKRGRPPRGKPLFSDSGLRKLIERLG